MTLLERIAEWISPRPHTEKSEPVQRLSRTQKEAHAAAEQLQCDFSDAERMLRDLVKGANDRDLNAR